MKQRNLIGHRVEKRLATAPEAGSAPIGTILIKTAVFVVGAAAFAAAAFSAANSTLFVNGVLPKAFSARTVKSQEGAPDIVKLVDGIPGWVRSGEIQTFAKETLYGYIDGGAEIVLQYGFRKLIVIEFRSASGTQPEQESLPLLSQDTASTERATACLAFQEPRELSLEIYEMEDGEAAFGLYSTKVDGGETTSERIAPAHWISPGQANFVKGEYLANILAPDLSDKEIEDFAAALEPKIPGKGTVRPAGVAWLPREDLVPGSERYIKGEPAALGESPLLEKAFWGFGPQGTVAYSAKYSPFPSRVVIVDFGRETGGIEDLALELFRDYLSDARKDDDGVVEGRSPVGHWFLFEQDKKTGRFAALVLGEPDEATARARLSGALKNVGRE